MFKQWGEDADVEWMLLCWPSIDVKFSLIVLQMLSCVSVPAKLQTNGPITKTDLTGFCVIVSLVPEATRALTFF